MLINENEIKYINKNGSLALPVVLALLQHHRLGTVVQEVHRLRVEVQILEQRSQQRLEVSQHFRILTVEVHPDLHSVERLHVLGRDEAETIDVFGEIEVLPH